MHPRTRCPVVLDTELPATLATLANARSTSARERRAAQVSLAGGAGRTVGQIMAETGSATGTVVRLCRRFREAGWAAARSEAARGRPTSYEAQEQQRVLAWAM